MSSTWIAVAARTGDLLAELPDLSVPRVKQTIGRFETATATLPVSPDVAPDDWERATKRGAAFVILLDDNPSDRGRGLPTWGGLITRRRRNHTDNVTLDLITGEGYLDRRYVGDEVFDQVGQNSIFESIIESYVVDGAAGRPGIPLRVEVMSDGVGELRDRTVMDQDDKTVYSFVQDLMSVKDGPEWTIGWEWQSNPERITPVLYVGDRLGSDPPEGLTPPARFDMPGNVRAVDLVEDYGEGRGANDVMAVSSGEGNLRPQSDRAVDDSDADMPTFEHRFTPSTSIVRVETLNEHAAKALSGMSAGVSTLSLTAEYSEAPRLGVMWGLGDLLAFDVTAGKLPAFPTGLSGTGRAAGWERSFGGVEEITPVVASMTIGEG